MTSYVQCSINFSHRIMLPAAMVGVIFYLAYDVVTNLRQLQSISGNVIFIFGLYITSKHPSRVKSDFVK